MDKYFYMCNVVWYDGDEAYVSKFVLECECDPEYGTVKGATVDAKEKVERYLSGNGEILKIEPYSRYDLELITGLSRLEGEMFAAYGRFNEMYFRKAH